MVGFMILQFLLILFAKILLPAENISFEVSFLFLFHFHSSLLGFTGYIDWQVFWNFIGFASIPLPFCLASLLVRAYPFVTTLLHLLWEFLFFSDALFYWTKQIWQSFIAKTRFLFLFFINVFDVTAT